MLRHQLVTNAAKFAVRAHGDQKYGEEFPYALHLQAVESVLIRFGVTDEVLLAAGWLHDTLEDTEATYEEVATYFGEEVLSIVATVTEPKGMTRKERHAVTHPKIRQNARAIIVKLADRISHVESGGRKSYMYLDEHLSFKQGIQNLSLPANVSDLVSLQIRMWAYLDNLIIEARERRAEEKAERKARRKAESEAVTQE
jgi:guanosine-3',5'-bis(diphosphate) 3'-pyrophosphohydrolase